MANLFDIHNRYLANIHFNSSVASEPGEDFIKEMSIKATTLEKAITAKMTGVNVVGTDMHGTVIGTTIDVPSPAPPLSTAGLAHGADEIAGASASHSRSGATWLIPKVPLLL